MSCVVSKMQNEKNGKTILYYIKKVIWKCIKIARWISIFDVAYIYMECKNNNKELIHFKVDSIEDYCICNGETFIEIEPECNRPVFMPAYFEKSEGTEYFFKSPKIYVVYLNSVMIVGSTGLVLTKKKVLFDGPKYDTEHRIMFQSGALRKCDKNIAFIEVEKGITSIEKAINLCGFASTNYYHITMEILSRLEYINQLSGTRDIPILIDEEIRLYPQMEQLLLIIKKDREIIYVEKGVRVKVDSLIHPSMNTWMPINVMKREMFRLSDNLIAESGIKNIKSCVDQYIEKQTNRKIYISRKSANIRRIVNEDKIIPLFESAGFEIVQTEDLSYLEQVRLFSSAKCVVGASGAAMTNIIYCNQGTVIGCIIPQEYGFCIYSTIAHLVGCKTLFLNVDVIQKNNVISADFYEVNEDICKRYINELSRMCNT